MKTGASRVRRPKNGKRAVRPRSLVAAASGRQPMPKEMRDAVERARRAAAVVRQLRKYRAPDPERRLAWPVEQQQAQAILSRAQATYEAWSRRQEWADARQVTADFNAFSDFVADIIDRLSQPPSSTRAGSYGVISSAIRRRE